jgi:hypothetical protein
MNKNKFIKNLIIINKHDETKIFDSDKNIINSILKLRIQQVFLCKCSNSIDINNRLSFFLINLLQYGE